MLAINSSLRRVANSAGLWNKVSQRGMAYNIESPIKKLQFIQHPRYGQVYPIVCVDTSSSWYKSGRRATVAVTVVNGLIQYSNLVGALFVPQVAAILCNPMFFVPSLFVNYWLYQYNVTYFIGDKSFVVNIFLKPNGKQIIVDSIDGSSVTIDTDNIYEKKSWQSKYEKRITFGHGANQQKFIRGNTHIYDSWALDAVLSKKFIDVKNVAYNFDVTKEFTWEFRDLVEIKKRKKIVNRLYKPTAKVLSGIDSAKRFERASKAGLTRSNIKPFENYATFKYFPDEVFEPADQLRVDKETAQHELNTKNAGKPLVVAKVRTSQGRRVQPRPALAFN